MVVGAMGLAQAAPISIDGNAITLTGIVGVALMVGKSLQQLATMQGDIRRILKRVFPEEYKRDDQA